MVFSFWLKWGKSILLLCVDPRVKHEDDGGGARRIVSFKFLVA